MTCPYADPQCSAEVSPSSRRCACGRTVKRCAACGANSRAFANFCRSCGKPLPAGASDWSSHRGDVRRLGFNPADAGRFGPTTLALTLQLGDECRALLGYDGHLIAVSKSGTVEIADPHRGDRRGRFQMEGPVVAQPCLRNGVLFLAAGRTLAAYPLGGLTLDPPRLVPAWSFPLDATPIHALTVVGPRLYVTVASPAGREIQVIDDVARPTSPHTIHAARRTSWIAADPHQEVAVFFSENDGRHAALHVAARDLETRAVALRHISEHPIALAGGTAFAVFGESHRLYRIDVATGQVAETLDDDTQYFALAHSDDGWNLEMVLIDTAGIRFSRSGIRDPFGPYDRAVKGSPVIVRDTAVLAGMEDGRVRIYDAERPPRHELWIVGGSSAPITALASFDHYVAAGNREGVVEVRALGAKGRAA